MSPTLYFICCTLAAIICISSAASSSICPQECDCYKDTELNIVANCSNIQSIIKSLKNDEVPSIDKLYLSHANVKKINKNFEKLNVELLDLSYNKLQSINNLPKHIATLVLNNNDLTSLEVSSIPPLVEHLDLSFNKITELSSEVMSLSNLISIHLEGNPLRCSCETIKMRDYFQRLDIFTDDVTCITKTNKEVYWWQIKISDVCHSSKFSKVSVSAFDDEDEMMGDDPLAGVEGSGEVDAIDGVESDYIPVKEAVTTTAAQPLDVDTDEGSGDEPDGYKSGDFDFVEPTENVDETSTPNPLGRQVNIDEETEAPVIKVETISIDGSGSGDARGFNFDEIDGTTTENVYGDEDDDNGSGSGLGIPWGRIDTDDDEDSKFKAENKEPSTESPIDESSDSSIIGFRDWGDDKDEDPIEPPVDGDETTPEPADKESTIVEDTTPEDETTTYDPDGIYGGLSFGPMKPYGVTTESPIIEEETTSEETVSIVPNVPIHVDDLSTKEPVFKETETTKAPVLEPNVGRKRVTNTETELIKPSEKVDGADDASLGKVQTEPKQGSTSTYVCLGILGICLVALIAYVALKRRRAYQGVKRQERRDAENPGTEMLDMDKALLGKPNDDDKKNGNSEISPLVSNGEKEPTIVPSKFPGSYANGKRENDIPAYKSEIPPLTTFGKEKPAKQDEPQLFSKPTEKPAEVHDKNVQKPTEVDSKPVLNEDVPKQKAPPLSKQESLTDDVFIPNEESSPNNPNVPPRYSPVYSPDTGRVKIKMTSIPDSIPKTPVMVTRSRSNAGDIVITPTPNPKFTKP